MRNIRLFAEFASVVMPGAVLLLIVTLLFGPPEWLTGDFASSGLGITTGLVFSFAAGHLLQGFAQVAIEPLWPRVQLRSAAEWAVCRFSGHEGQRYLTREQIGQLELQYPLKLGIPFPGQDSLDEATLESTIAHAESFLYAAKISERLDDLLSDYKLNKGLFVAFLLVSVLAGASLAGWMRSNASGWTALIFGGSVVAGVCSFVRMDYHSRKYAQTLFLQFLSASTAIGAGGGGGKGEGGGGGGLPMGMGRGRAGAPRAQTAAQDEEEV